jgi:hypothetical protein
LSIKRCTLILPWLLPQEERCKLLPLLFRTFVRAVAFILGQLMLLALVSRLLTIFLLMRRGPSHLRIPVSIVPAGPLIQRLAGTPLTLKPSPARLRLPSGTRNRCKRRNVSAGVCRESFPAASLARM